DETVCQAPVRHRRPGRPCLSGMPRRRLSPAHRPQGGLIPMPRTFTIRPWQEADLPALVTIWNQVVEDGVAFPQEDLLTEEAGRAFFAAQSRTAVAVTPAGEVLGLYILHPNNIGRCGHI